MALSRAVMDEKSLPPLLTVGGAEGGGVQWLQMILFVLGFYGPVNNEVMSSRSVKSGSVPGQA